MKNIYKIAAVFLTFIVAYSCSTKKDAFVNRQYHAISTKYNVLFNGEQAFLQGLEALNANYEDNYWDVLPIEPLKVDELAMPGMMGDTDSSPQEFERAEEKAVKAIQKHSMLIARQERNSQIDAAYLLLGKARYYSKRFVPSLEAFNYIIINYPTADLIDEAWIWRSKTHVRLRNEEIAIDRLKTLLTKESISKIDLESAHTTLAMAYQSLDSIPQVIYHLNQAVVTDYNKEQTARNLFVLGQLYQNKNERDSANIAFQKVIDLKKSPYKYKIHAEIEQAKNVSNKEEALVMIEELERLIKDRYNREYLDELYFRLGEITAQDDVETALYYYKNAVETSTNNSFQKELSYEAIGNIYFDKAEFSTAGAYYDSILQISTNENSKRIRSIKRKRNNLDEVIAYEDIAKKNDSILEIVAMSPEEQNNYFNSYIKKLQAEEERKLLAQELQGNTGSSFYNANDIGGSSNSGKWYFYNTQSAGFGQQEFLKIWGNRPLEDNWRLSNKMQLNNTTITTVETTTPQIDASQKYDVATYIAQLPSTQDEIDVVVRERNNAYYNLGIIYKSQFKEIDLAISKLEKLLTFNPKNDILIPLKYHLYKMYTTLNSEKAAVYKNDITSNYPDSKYAKIILNPTEISNADTSNSPESMYANAFHEYKNEDFNSVIEKSNKAIIAYEGQAIVAKFELLKAYAIGKKEGVDAFKNALEFVLTNYPNTEEGKKAEEVLQSINSKI
ncbi:hypothetical protein ACFQ5N_03710 [Lutibacter holmesii]|uniref:Tetratricopeptide repeat protein n=1 Tax=Lutibacter holmesii TaxID=1137985 RepID=A0ABW3WLI3_9FLAO